MKLPRLSPDGDRVLSAATQISVELEHRFLGVEHLFLGLARERRGDMKQAFARFFDIEHFADVLRTKIREDDDSSLDDEMVQTPRCRRVLELAGRIALRTGGNAIEPRHLLQAIFSEGRSVPVRLLRALDVDVTALKEALLREPDPAPTPTPLLDRFGRDLTAMAARGQLSPVIGREHEMDLIAQVLLRKNKNNPVLVGEAGVGKTAVVEGFAQRLVSSDCPEPLKGRRVIELSLAGLVAGTKYRGQFEERLLEITREVGAHRDVILFLDEIHSLVGAGATGDDSMDASNILKPALARGELRCIGATTIDEYRRHIEKDPALERRFEKTLIEEPSPQDALVILERVKPSLEQHHRVTIEPDAIRAAVDLTVKHVFDRHLPDKALDAIDQSCARKRLQRYAEDAKREVQSDEPVRVDGRDVATTVSHWTGIPLERISGEAAKHLLNIEEDLKRIVIGQDRAVRAVARTILTAKAGLAEPNRPLGVFFFAGPTGVGKTWLAKSLAHVLFGDAKRLVRLDMSEYMEPHSISNLIGAPPGYVGHEREGQLISALRTHPHCIVLFDEVEKAHPKVFDLFLQIFDEGRLMGTHGRAADFTQAVVILTSNIQVSDQAPALGFHGEGKSAEPVDPRTALALHLRPELVNRIDEVVAFDPLDAAALRRIVDRYVAGIGERLAERDVRLELDEAVYARLLELAQTDVYGARELHRVVDRHVRQPLAEAVLRSGEIGAIHALVRDGEIRFEALEDEELPA